ncbi:KH domain-containing protein [Aphelenchoides avenae]|nr:KH domain-containing protein [Aphelenchus avenae]
MPPVHQPMPHYQTGRRHFDAGGPRDIGAQAALQQMTAELNALRAVTNGHLYTQAQRLLVNEIDKLRKNLANINPEWLDVDIQQPIKLVQKVLIPKNRYPHFNFIGKILGYKGQTMRNITAKFGCKILIQGAGSTRDRAKELQLLNSGDRVYEHYCGPLHVRVEIIAPPTTAYGRMAGVLDVLSRLLKPIRNDIIEGITVNVADVVSGFTAGQSNASEEGEVSSTGRHDHGAQFEEHAGNTAAVNVDSGEKDSEHTSACSSGSDGNNANLEQPTLEMEVGADVVEEKAEGEEPEETEDAISEPPAKLMRMDAVAEATPCPDDEANMTEFTNQSL